MRRGGVYVEAHYVCSKCGIEWPVLIPLREYDPLTSSHRPEGWQAYYSPGGETTLRCSECRKECDESGTPAVWRKKSREM